MMNPLIVQAIKKSSHVRMRLGLNIFEPINIFDACTRLGITVRFVDINMEGMYINDKAGSNPTILISNQRPFPRRCFTCAHELGHHVFEHGTKIDALTDDTVSQPSNDKIEHLVDAFAGALLMPIEGIKLEFNKRSWKPQEATPLQFYIICSVFGTGYTTLVNHCKANKLIDNAKAIALLKQTPAKILESSIGPISNKSYFKIIDNYTSLSTIDLELSNYIVFPTGSQVEGEHLRNHKESNIGTVYVAEKPGIIQVVNSHNSAAYFVRIQNFGYIGLAEYRHLETITN